MIPPNASSTVAATARLVILYGLGGLSDVGRHAVRAALEAGVGQVKVLTQHPELLEEPNWNSACVEPHIFTDEQRARLQVIPVSDWESPDPSLASHLKDASAVICCVGNRQPGWSQPDLKKGWVSYLANRYVVQALRRANPTADEQSIARRVVVMSSVGVAEDWPPMEFFTPAKIILGAMFILPGVCRKAYRDLSQTEALYRSLDKKKDESNGASNEKGEIPTDDGSGIDYLLVRPVGLGEDVEPVGDWKLQTKKYHDEVGGNMAKLDVARFMVQEAINPTLHRTAVVIGSTPEE